MSTTDARTSIRDINLASWSASGSCWNPTALQDPPPVPVPDDVDLNPVNIGAFASAGKFADGLNANGATTLKFKFKTVGQGTEGCLDFANGVKKVEVDADTLGQGGTNGTRIDSFKGGCEDIKVTGARNCQGKQGGHWIGIWCDESQALDYRIDISDPRLVDDLVIGRGLWHYLAFNRCGHVVGGCKLDFWMSLAQWLLVCGKGDEEWLLAQKWVPAALKRKIDPSYGT